ncbi:unnamed protein product [Chondrus crispus]|uniref:fructose-bisphosphate aldolase n=1 Tax=Chondrus crispus TaxID=2769 RepID=R7QF81_CHOCR|nr:unnamed protein product [Chondrus crispus]CDF36423.1 unnamed protein product [Chondrus crispus]|eukprot:XP_005716242.1 unnamed protein product [Chondrus crispus]
MSIEQYHDELITSANKIASPGKGIVALDESTKTIGKRLASIGVENSKATGQACRSFPFQLCRPWRLHLWRHPF